MEISQFYLSLIVNNLYHSWMYFPPQLFDDLFSDTEYIFLIVTETQDGKPESRACYVKTLKAPVTAYDLHRAIAKQDPSEVEDILEKNSHLVDVPDRNEVSPLMKATNLGCTGKYNYAHYVNVKE